MPPIVCNLRGVLAFYGSMNAQQDRPIVNGERWAYTTPTFASTHLTTSTRQMFAYGVGVVGINLEGPMSLCECEHVGA